jgi:ferredoxin
MALFTVNTNTCISCGACEAVCPTRLIKLGATDNIPAPIAGAEAQCISCGHCTAVCPTGALELANMPLAQCPMLNRELLPSAEQV